MIEAVWVTIWLACGGTGALLAWYRWRSVSSTILGLLVGFLFGLPVVAAAQFSLVGVVVAAVFVGVWMTLLLLLHRHRARRDA